MFNTVNGLLTFISSIITIVNSTYALPLRWLDLLATERKIAAIAAMQVPAKLVLVSILELSLAYAFGRAFGAACRADKLNRMIIFLVVSILSAWMSLFNIEVLLIGHTVSGFLEHALLFMLLFFAWALASVLISGHINLMAKTNKQENTEAGISIQGIAFIVIFLSLIFR